MIEKVEAFYSKLSGREQTLFLVAALFILLTLTDVIILRPISAKIKEMDGEIKAKAESIQRDLRILSFRDGILRDYSHYVHYLDPGEKSQEEIIAALLLKIETVAAEKSISISSIQPGENSSKSAFKEYKTTLVCEGTLRNVLGLMQALEDSDYLFRITKYDLAPKSKGSDIMKATIEMSRVLVGAEKVENEVLAKYREDHPEAVSSPPEAKEEEVLEEEALREPEIVPPDSLGEVKKEDVAGIDLPPKDAEPILKDQASVDKQVETKAP